MSSFDKLILLSLYLQLVVVDKQISCVSGGSRETIPLIYHNHLLKGINHFSVGEMQFLGTNVYNNSTFEKMHSEVFKLYFVIIESIEKPVILPGEFGAIVEGILLTLIKIYTLLV